MNLLNSSKIDLLPGVEKLLNELKIKNIKRCVVTNSSKSMTDMIRAKQVLLDTIPHWITREDYLKPKPNPDCYLHAISLYADKGDKIIGFEDSLRGIKSLQQTPAFSVLIGSILDPKVSSMLTKDVFHFKSFEDIPEKLL
jgi:HAD superfamily hydrolase (TIGR01509 family)